ncbi:MAG: hypothetical protein H0V42_11430 [Nocardioidaceae bacterium]|nr:hypothetical protein [Nocardioidaceae bacterium]
MTGLESAILGLHKAVHKAVHNPRRQHTWRWLVRHRMSAVKDALVMERSRGGDAWLAAREQTLGRECDGLVVRLAALGPAVLESPDVDAVLGDLQRLVHALEHYRQRLNDLVYDSVSLELGGSE